jgi:hypothetical protein
MTNMPPIMTFFPGMVKHYQHMQIDDLWARIIGTVAEVMPDIPHHT